MRKITIYLSLLLSLALVTTACVSDAEETTTTTAAAAPTETTEAQAPATTAPATPDTTEGTVEPAGPVLIGSIHPLTGGLAGAGNRMQQAESPLSAERRSSCCRPTRRGQPRLVSLRLSA